MNLHKELQHRLVHLGRENTLRRMGYSNNLPKALVRLDKVLSDPNLGLSNSAYDFKYGSNGFLNALCDALGLEAKQYVTAIADIRRRLAEQSEAFKPYLFADTGFERANEPIFILAMLSKQRYLALPDYAYQLSAGQLLRLAQSMVAEHQNATQGELPVWGRVKRYLLFYRPERAMALTTDGELVGYVGKHRPAEACMEPAIECLHSGGH